jgi:hypothetical protein
MANLVTDILNPPDDVASQLHPDYSYPLDRPEGRAIVRRRNASPLRRRIDPSPMTIAISWGKRSLDIKDALLKWQLQYEGNFFQFYEPETGRYYAGNFQGHLQHSPSGNNQWAIQGIFEEYAGCALFQYPGGDQSEWDRWGARYDEQDDFGDLICGLNGAWPRTANAGAVGGFELLNVGADNTHFAKVPYFGYGFRIWLPKGPDRGNVEVSFDGFVLIASLDLYAAVATNSAVVVSKIDAPMNLHTVKLRPLHTKNGASSDYKVSFDAIEVMR